ncbi:uncharacterized protein LOC123533693 [Mercenaria mercenaria]|uniref:uncharacterized protein LOC123533693 n=1 Tax=Mercenaria mercenaria TaxID=6596 RepID=UPI00234E79F8|nr:uncharacterized protein LOC123533693 [Mercenaria mercenaria]
MPSFAASSTGSQQTAALFNSTFSPRPEVLLKTAVAEVYAENQYAQANILFDEGAQCSFISEKLADQLNIKPCDNTVVNLAAFGDSSQKVRHLKTATIYLLTDDGDKIPLNVLIVPVIAVPLRNIPQFVTSLPYLRHLKLAHPVIDDDKFEISLLIGADHFWKIVGNKIIRGNGPTAVSSRVGYLLSGPVPVTNVMTQSCFALNVMTTDIEKFWKLESIGISPEDDRDDCKLETYQQNSIKFIDGKYEAKLPWKEDHAPLPTNLEVTKKRTESLVRRLRREPNIFQKYSEIIQDQERRDFIEKVDENEQQPDRMHYIPHHAVKKDSATTPIRIVYDCSCQETSQKPSLNDCLDSTPPTLNDLSHIMIRFRLGKYAVSTDIEKTFLNVRLDKEDRDMTRFLWLSDPGNPDSPFTTYRFKSVLFGATCSPFILNATLLKHLENNASSWVSRFLKRDLYVDNIISSFSTEEEVLKFFRETRDLMLNGGFNLRSWASNSQQLRSTASAEGVLDTGEITKVLGMLWLTVTDEISYPNKEIPVIPDMTKRAILQYTSRIYDPLGLLNPVLVRAKILLQDLWKEKYPWDTILPEQIQKKWFQLARDINNVTEVKFSRLIFKSSEADDNTLHVFVDSSIQAYGAAAYLCRGKESRLIMAKSRVAPLKKLTLPKLELMAAVIGARLAKHLLKAIDVQNVTFWSDSQIVLHWLNTSRPTSRFVQNRVNEIRELAHNRKWNYCPTRENRQIC